MADLDRLGVGSLALGPVPILNHVVRRLHIDDLLLRHLDGERTTGPTPGQSLSVLLRNILLDRGPFYALQRWASQFHPAVFGLDTAQLRRLNDDRVGRAADRLFEADRSSMLTEVVVRAITEFDLDLSEFHNDSTSIALQGQYSDATGGIQRGKKTLRITHGHSKDHRPDLKQLLWVLTVTADGMVPVHYTVHDGNTNDSPTHEETWETVRKLAGRADFLYVADSKACVTAFLQHVDAQGGRIVTVLPRTRKEDGWFREYLQTHEPAWVEVAMEPDPRSVFGPPIVWKAVESPMPSAEGFRVIWIWNSQKEEQDQVSRQAQIAKAVRRLEDLERRLQSPKTKIRTREGVVRAAEKAIGRRADRWVVYTIREEEVPRYKQERRGRPGKETRYRKEVRVRYHVSTVLKEEVIAFDAKCDGKWPLLTNDKTIGIVQVVRAYREQPKLEKRFEQLKTVYAVAPVFLKKVTRIEGLLFVYFLALLVEALLEREMRRAMERDNLPTIPIYPEFRPSEAPTANVILRQFDYMMVSRLEEDGRTVREFWPKLDDLQKKLLKLLRIPERVYQEAEVATTEIG